MMEYLPGGTNETHATSFLPRDSRRRRRSCISSCHRCGQEDHRNVFKVLNNAFTPPLQEGCAQAAKDFNVDCIFVGPPEYNEAQEVQMLQDMIQRGVDGLAVSAANPKAMARALKQAQDRGIPVVMFDSDVLPEDKGVRLTFIGTDNYAFGAELAKAVLQ